MGVVRGLDLMRVGHLDSRGHERIADRRVQPRRPVDGVPGASGQVLDMRHPVGAFAEPGDDVEEL